MSNPPHNKEYIYDINMKTVVYFPDRPEVYHNFGNGKYPDTITIEDGNFFGNINWDR